MAEAMTQTGPTLILTRPNTAAARFLAQVQTALDRPITAIISPLIRIGYLRPYLPKTPCSGLIFTSENAATAAGRLGLNRALPVFAVGGQTAGAAREAGFAAMSAQGDAASLVALILSLRPQGPLWHIRGEHARGDVAQRLTAGGIATIDLIAYRQEPLALTALARAALDGTGPVVLPLFSPRTVSILADQGPFAAPLQVVAISSAVATAAQALPGAQVHQSPRPDGEAMLTATIALLQGRAVLEGAAPSG